MTAGEAPSALSAAGIALVLFDMAGTTVGERADAEDASRVGHLSLVERAFVRAFAAAGIEIGPEAVRPHRGREKLDAIRSVLAQRREGGAPDGATAEAIHHAFLTELELGIDSFHEVPGASATFRFLRERGIRVGVGSGFPRAVVERLVASLGWEERELVDYVQSAETLGAGRPDPVMIVDAMARLDVADPRSVVKVGDTVLDVEEGRNAGAWTVGVLTGAHDREELLGAGADYVVPSVAELPELFG